MKKLLFTGLISISFAGVFCSNDRTISRLMKNSFKAAERSEFCPYRSGSVYRPKRDVLINEIPHNDNQHVRPLHMSNTSWAVRLVSSFFMATGIIFAVDKIDEFEKNNPSPYVNTHFRGEGLVMGMALNVVVFTFLDQIKSNKDFDACSTTTADSNDHKERQQGHMDKALACSLFSSTIAMLVHYFLFFTPKKNLYKVQDEDFIEE